MVVLEENLWSDLERLEIKRHLERLLNSETFSSSKHLQDIFRYLVEQTLDGRTNHINQTTIAIDVLGRDEHFDPSVDSLVRVEMARLRTKLRDYYYAEGREDTIKFEFPKGRYIPRITVNQVPESQSVQTGSSVASPVSNRRSLYPVLLAGISVVLLLVIVLYRYLPQEDAAIPDEAGSQATPEQTPAPVDAALGKSVAVLPFDNRSEDAQDAYFTDGLHDDLLTQLTKIRDLKVIAQSSVMHYRDTNTPLPKIAEELHVDSVLLGSVQRSGDRIRIQVQFINARTEEYLWAESFDRELTTANIFDIQRDIADRTAQTLQTTITPEEQERLAAVPTDNLEAYEAYLLGRRHMADRNSDDLTMAVDYFKQAIELDHNFALAYANLAAAYFVINDNLQLSNDEHDKNIIKAEIALNQALDLDKELDATYATSGLLKASRGDTDGAIIDWQKALALNPNNIDAYNWYAGVLSNNLNDQEKALEIIHKAIRIDPLSAILNVNLADVLTKLGRFDEALAQHKKAIEIAPNASYSYFTLGIYYYDVEGRADQAYPWSIKGYFVDPGRPLNSLNLAFLFWNLGDDEQAACWARRAISAGPDTFYGNFAMYSLYLREGDEARMLEYARKLLRMRPAYYYPLSMLRDQDLQAGKNTQARARYATGYPELLAQGDTIIEGDNYQAAIDLAAVLLRTGEIERANKLLNSSLEYIKGIPRLGLYGYRIKDVDIYALLGRTDQALAALRSAIDAGWRPILFTEFEHNLNLESIRNKPEFESMLNEVKDDMAAQLARVKEMQQKGDICITP